MKFFYLIFKISDFYRQIYLNGAGCGKWNLKNQNLCKILGISIKDTFCSSLFLYNFETYQKLPYKINWSTRVFTFFYVHHNAYIYWAFSDPKRPGLSEIDPELWKFLHCQTLKKSLFEPKKTHCAWVSIILFS